MRFAVEAWSPEYGVSGDESQLDEHAEPVDLDVEVAAKSWEPIRASTLDTIERVVFVDGVRRIDARIWVDDGGQSRQGVCASVAAGAVVCTPQKATVTEVAVFRGFFTQPLEKAENIQTKHGDYVYVPCASDRPEDIYLGIHDQMTSLETSLQVESSEADPKGESDGGDLIVFDGPLRGRNSPNSVGYVKTQHVQYLPDSHQPILGRLSAGERTPLFHIGGRFGRYSWYLRLPSEQTHPLAGIVRCEVAAVGPPSEAIALAVRTSGVLPWYGSEPHKDSRAPQNLYPIAGLENQLRHRLGDPLVLERALRNAAS